MDDDGIEELEARVTLVELALALLLGREGLDQLRGALHDEVQGLHETTPSSLTEIETRPKLLRRFQQMEDRLDVLEGIVSRHRRSTPPNTS